MPREKAENDAPLGTEVVIERLGHLGDGLGEGHDGPVHIAGAAPGDTFVREGQGWRLLRAGAVRADPPCPHYEVCGGCNLQHVAQEAYLAAKREWVVAALANQGLDVPVEPVAPAEPGTRRRAALAIIGGKPAPTLGFHRRKSREVVEVPHCLILRPRIVAAFDAVKALLGSRLPPGRGAQATLTEVETGVDLALEGHASLARPFSADEIAKAGKAGIVRASVNGETLFQSAPARLSFSGTVVELPPGGFVQAVAEAEAVLAAEVCSSLEGARRIADLYCGVGTFTFALAREARISAFDGDALSIVALETAARHATGLKQTRAEVRDLGRRPLMPQELKRIDGVVLDPPRSGAETQARALARSAVKRIAYVSCHPASFARDARILCEGGYRLTRVAPVDQFLWSHHVELVGTFVR